jgi:hypothetical protein
MSLYPINAFLKPVLFTFLPNTITGAELRTVQFPRCKIDKGVLLLIPTLPL